ncbi:MAG: hypothetical protein U0R71_08450 [Solirubrobacterales bacterium]
MSMLFLLGSGLHSGLCPLTRWPNLAPRRRPRLGRGRQLDQRLLQQLVWIGGHQLGAEGARPPAALGAELGHVHQHRQAEPGAERLEQPRAGVGVLAPAPVGDQEVEGGEVALDPRQRLLGSQHVLDLDAESAQQAGLGFVRAGQVVDPEDAPAAVADQRLQPDAERRELAQRLLPRRGLLPGRVGVPGLTGDQLDPQHVEAGDAEPGERPRDRLAPEPGGPDEEPGENQAPDRRHQHFGPVGGERQAHDQGQATDVPGRVLI